MNDPPRPGARPIRFGVFELDTQSRELRKAGVRLNLPEQPFQILECLLERPGELVNRDELRKRLWPGDTFVDFEHGLNAAVKRLRDVLGDSADSPRFVETVPRRGYRFVAPVERAPNEVGHSPEMLVVVPPAAAPGVVGERRRGDGSGGRGLRLDIGSASGRRGGAASTPGPIVHTERVGPLANVLTGWHPGSVYPVA